jgi:hypothetical protein
VKRRVPGTNIRWREDVVCNVEFSSAAQGSRDDLAVAWSDHQTADFVQQRLARPRLELTPEIVRSAQNGDVHRVFEVRLANDAAVAV